MQISVSFVSAIPFPQIVSHFFLRARRTYIVACREVEESNAAASSALQNYNWWKEEAAINVDVMMHFDPGSIIRVARWLE